MNKSFAVFYAFFLITMHCSAASSSQYFFFENFNEQKEWFPQKKVDGCSNSSCKNELPSGWDYYRNDEMWHPSFNGTQFHPTIIIATDNSKGNTGKALTIWNESNKGNSGDGWGADGILAKDLGQDYQSVYVQLFIKFQPGFKWFWETNTGAAVKMVRIYHWDRSGSPFAFFNTGFNAPAYIYDTSQNQYGFRHFHSHRCDPQESSYWCTEKYDKSYNFPGATLFENNLGDGEWHQMNWHVKMNTAPGIKDGIVEFWVDGVLAYSRHDIQWLENNSPKVVGWNIVAIGGNAYNLFAQPEEMKEQWYAIDDVTVSSTPIPIITKRSIK